ncbi:MAG TPA: carbohydrate kinase family protein [Anaerolineae bacterium]|nr:carbohydrate kinase family protein [Anaerolineae bacterium]
MIDSVVAGHLCLDVIPDLSGTKQDQIEAILKPGRLVLVGSVNYCTGGPVSNTGLALTKLGIHTQLMGKVGDDLFGHAIQDYVRAYGSDLVDAMIVDPTVHTSYTIVLNPPGVDRIFLHHPGANDTFGADDIRYDLIEGARLFHFGYPPLMRRMYENGGSDLTEIFRRAKATGVTTSLDMALPDPSSPAGRANWRDILSSVLPYVDLFLPSIEEILFMLHPATYKALCEEAGGPSFLPFVQPKLLSDLSHELIEFGAKIVALKLGDRGLYLRTAGLNVLEEMGRARPHDAAAWAQREMWAPCFQVTMIGTTGSGDATIAGLLAGLLRSLSPEDAVTAAVAVGACNVEAADALGGIRTWDETWDRVRAGWPRRQLVLDTPEWVLDDTHKLWVPKPGVYQAER